METQIDFLQCLQPDMALKILTYLDDSADLVRASAVSKYLQNIVVSNGLSKKLCVTRFPQLASITNVVEVSHDDSKPRHSYGESEHRAYASLFRALTGFQETRCIARPVSASSTDNYPIESIVNTLDPRVKILHRDSYWSSKGSDNPETPETLIYKLTADICVITEIVLNPFQAVFQLDFPIYSSKSVRFRMGHQKSWSVLLHDYIEAQECADDKFVWTYTSPVFPMARENRLQTFKLPEPAVCIGGILQIELLGRVQEQAADGKYYICVAYVQAVGRKLSPVFSAEFSELSDRISLKYDAEKFGLMMRNVSGGHDTSLSTSSIPIQPRRQLTWGNLQGFIHTVQAHPDGVEYGWIDDDELQAHPAGVDQHGWIYDDELQAHPDGIDEHGWVDDDELQAHPGGWIYE